VLTKVLAEALSALDSQDQCLAFSALDLIPPLGELGLGEPKLTLGQFFNSRFGVNARTRGLFPLSSLACPTLSKGRPPSIFPTIPFPGKAEHAT
jgi:hypothetical protein